MTLPIYRDKNPVPAYPPLSHAYDHAPHLFCHHCARQTRRTRHGPECRLTICSLSDDSEPMGPPSHLRCLQPSRAGLLRHLLRLVSGFVAEAAQIRHLVRIPDPSRLLRRAKPWWVVDASCDVHAPLFLSLAFDLLSYPPPLMSPHHEAGNWVGSPQQNPEACLDCLHGFLDYAVLDASFWLAFDRCLTSRLLPRHGSRLSMTVSSCASTHCLKDRKQQCRHRSSKSQHR